MDTNVHDESTEDTEETECLADVGHCPEDFVGRRRLLRKEDLQASVCSAVRHASRKRKQRHAEA
ncbi:MAG: hypothetical protein K6G44_02995 [Lentisphaeria bacterium]|nr:hypothetical protein [Lentisphaeria bacterium]